MAKRGDPAADASTSFEKLARGRSGGLLREMIDFLLRNGKWWLVPILAVLLLVAALVALGATGAAPFIYTLF